MVLFMFSDIEGSTARWESDPEAMRAALRMHDDILDSTIREHSGHVFKTVGDQFCSVFTRASDALAAAIDIQKRLNAADFSAVGELRARIAIYPGEADERSGDYFGPAVNRVARLLSVGHGGQILLPEIIANMESALPHDAGTMDLGWHRLKGIDRPERIFQLSFPGLDTDFKPLQSLTVTANNLPHQVSSFIGRAQALKDVAASLRSSRLVSIVGSGGIGKTSLALAVARETLQEFRDGAWFIDLAPLAEGSLVAGTVLTVLGAKPGGNASPLQTLVDYLTSRSMLLVFDNCEHLVAEVATAIAEILRSTEQVKVLATSREQLTIEGEIVYRLDALDINEATQLFIERASSAKADFAPGPLEFPQIVDICRRLDCVALAIELAAPKVRLLSLAELNARLDQRFRLLNSGSRSAQPRQQTMQAVIGWSYDLLSEPEKLLFRRLGVFVGSFSLESIGGVCCDCSSDDYETLELLSGLIDKSLVAADKGEITRYSMLQSIREYALERIRETGEEQPLRLAHSQFYAKFLVMHSTQWDNGADPQWLARGSAEVDNVRAAITWALLDGHDPATGCAIAADSFPLYLRLSLLRESESYCAAALARPALPARIAAKLHYGLSMIHNNLYAFESAVLDAQAAAAFFEESGDTKGVIGSLGQLAQLCARCCNYDDALRYSRDCLKLARTCDDARLLAISLQRCSIALPAEDIETARMQFEEAIKLLTSLDLPQDIGRVIAWWGSAEADAGQFARALELLRQAIGLASEDSTLSLTLNLSEIALLCDDREIALENSREAMALAYNLGHKVAFLMATMYFAAALVEIDPPRSLQLATFVHGRLAHNEWLPAGKELAILENLDRTLAALVPSSEPRHLEAGSIELTQEQVLSMASDT